MRADIVIVGSGCAGMYCALNLPKDKNILIITKDIVEHSDSFLAQGGMCMLKDEEDFDSYFYDTMKAGHFENDTAAVETMRTLQAKRLQVTFMSSVKKETILQ